MFQNFFYCGGNNSGESHSELERQPNVTMPTTRVGLADWHVLPSKHSNSRRTPELILNADHNGDVLSRHALRHARLPETAVALQDRPPAMSLRQRLFSRGPVTLCCYSIQLRSGFGEGNAEGRPLAALFLFQYCFIWSV